LLLTDEWCAFFKQHSFFIGISLDGPREVHDRYRKGRAGEPTFDGVTKKFFRHIRKYLRPLAQLIAHGQPASLIMRAFEGPLMIPLAHNEPSRSGNGR
jgi:sulfatase maturation enzyme AslB (radical SAM superfamily)